MDRYLKFYEDCLVNDPKIAEAMRQDPFFQTVMYKKAIRKVLLRDWNPIGVSGLPDDEYDHYLGFVYYFLKNHRPKVEVVEYLLYVEREWMSEEGNRERALAVADKLFQLQH